MLRFVCTRAASLILGAAFSICALGQCAWASSVVVGGTCRNLPSYPNIQTAVNSVPSGSTIFVCPGNYPEQILINKSLTITGLSANGNSGTLASGLSNPVITSPSGGITANLTDIAGGDPVYYQIAAVSPNPASPITVKINSIAVDGSNNQISGCGMDLVGIYYQNAWGTINYVVTRYQELAPDLFGCQDGLAIFVESGYGTGGTANVTIENSSVHDYDKNGITVDGTGTVATVSANFVVGIGATSLIAQNGIQVSDGARGSVKSNTITDDVYINPPDCGTACYGSSGILIYDSGATSGSHLAVSENTVGNTQLPVVAYADTNGDADYIDVTSNKITTAPASGTYLDDGIDLCGNYDTATSNTIFNTSGTGVHIDSSSTEASGQSGNNTAVNKNIINEACAGVLLGTGTGDTVGTAGANSFFNVVETTQSGNSCPVGSPSRPKGKLKALPRRP